MHTHARVHTHHRREDTATRLLLLGWNLQHRARPLPPSLISRRQAPEAGSHSLAVPSDDTDTSTSLATDQSKSSRENGVGRGTPLTQREVHRCTIPLTALWWPRSVATREGGSEDKLKTERVPSREAQASRLLSSLANLMAVTGRKEREPGITQSPVCASNLHPYACQRYGACHKRHSALRGWSPRPWPGWPLQIAWEPGPPVETLSSCEQGCGGPPSPWGGSPCSGVGSAGKH